MDGLDVVEVLEGIDQAQHPRCHRSIHRDGGARELGHFGVFDGHPAILQGLPDRPQVAWGR